MESVSVVGLGAFGLALTERGIKGSRAGLSKVEVNAAIAEDLEANFAESGDPDFG